MANEFNQTEEDILSVINDEPAKQVADGEDTTQGGDEGAEDNTNAGSEGKGEEDGQGKGTKGPEAKPKDGKAGDGKPTAPVKGAKTPQQVNEENATRRIQQDNVKLKGTNQTLLTENTTLKAKLDGITQAQAATNSYGLQADEIAEGARIIADWKKNPVAVIEELLTVAKQNAIDLSSLKIGGIDTKAMTEIVRQEIGARLDPLRERHEAQELDATAKAEAIQEVEEFFTATPEAESHIEALTTILQSVPGMSIATAWKELRLWAYDNGINLTSPQAPANGGTPRDNTTVRKPLPNGGGRYVAGNGSNDEAPASPKPKNTGMVGQSIDSIINEAMAEAGLTYRR